MNELLQSLEAAEGPWRDILCLTRLPDESKRPEWARYDAALHKKYVGQKTEYSLNSHDAYVSMYVASMIKYSAGGQDWKKHLHAQAPVLLAAQKADGSFSTGDVKDTPTATALASLSVLVIDHGSSQFFPPHKKNDKVETGVDEAIEVEVTK